MPLLEFASRFIERRERGTYRSPAVVVLELGGGYCNKAGQTSCKEFCAVPQGRLYNPNLDPSMDMLADLFSQVMILKPAIVSLVPNCEGVDTIHHSNTYWDEVFKLGAQDYLKEEQLAALRKYYTETYRFPLIRQNHPTTPAEKIALTIAVGKSFGLNLSLTTNGCFLTRELLWLYKRMGLQTINLSFHPNKPFNPNLRNVYLDHLLCRAEEAIEVGITPTITHLLTRQNAETFISLADYITERDIFFAAGIANACGGSFSTANQSIEPSDEQVKAVFRRLLARKLFADRNIRTTVPYLIMAPYLRQWRCSQSTDFFHISVEAINGKLQPKLNVCSEIRPDVGIQFKSFLSGGELNIPEYLKWRNQANECSQSRCIGCTHQCFFEAEARQGLGTRNSLELWDYWDTLGKALRLRHTFRHPVRPTVSSKEDFQKSYLWESLLQGVTRQVAFMAKDGYWQETFQRSGTNYETLVAASIEEASNPKTTQELVESEKKDAERLKRDWHDAANWQSVLLRSRYLLLQKSGREAELAIPLKYASLLGHESPETFQEGIEKIVYQRRLRSRTAEINDPTGVIFPMIAGFLDALKSVGLKKGSSSRYYFND